MKTSYVVLLVAVVVSLSRADVTLAPLFQDHAVLQRDKPIPIWGRSSPGEDVTISFAGQTRRTRADSDGRWRVELSALAMQCEPAELRVQGHNLIVLSDILVGDVWLCSGQSNMAWSVGASANPDAETAAARWPLIRQIKFPWAVADTPQERVEGSWEVCSPCTVGTFTAVGYYFARDVHRELKVPVGIVNCSVGGSSIEAWLGREALSGDPRFAVVNERWLQTLASADPAKTADYFRRLAAWKNEVARTTRAQDGSVAPAPPLPPPGPGHFSTPSGFFNGMLFPCVPYALKGFLWYQGEANAIRADEYELLFKALISDWRRVFRQGDLPFYWVQLPNFNPKDETGMSWAALREAQCGALKLPFTGQAITIDIGNPDSAHPYNKQDVGIRLAALAMARTYGLAKDDSGPRLIGVEKQGSSLRLSFCDAETGLEARGPLVGFELAATDLRYVPADARIEGDSVVVSSPQVSDAVYVRYAWRNSPQASLFDKEGLPAGPFRAKAGENE